MTTETASKNIGHEKRAFLYVLGVCSVLSFLWLFVGDGWVWTSTIPRSFPAVKLTIPRAAKDVMIRVAGDPTEIRFVVAADEASVRSFWMQEGDSIYGRALVACDGGAKASELVTKECAEARKKYESDKNNKGAPAFDQKKCEEEASPAFSCSMDRDGAIRIERKKPAAPVAGKGADRTSTLWVIPFVDAGAQGIFPRESINWRSVTIQWEKGSPTDVAAGSCASPDLKLADCRIVHDLLGRPRLVSKRDPQVVMTSIAKDAADRVVPLVVVMMVIGDVMLLGAAAWLTFRWAVGRPLVERSKDGKITQADTEWPGARLVLEWLEVIGPATAFAGTVLGLVVAFDPAVFADHEGATFSATISAAMTITFFGLLMRVLAFTVDRLVHHLTRWHADGDGYVHPADTGEVTYGDAPDPAAADAAGMSGQSRAGSVGP